MLFNSFDFCVFFSVVFLLQRALRHRARNIVLLAAGYSFYAYWDWRFLWLLVATAAAACWCGRRIHEAHDPRTRRLWLLSALVWKRLGYCAYS